MGLPYWGYANLVPDATISARTAAASPFDAAALNKRQLHPAYHSGNMALELNGADEYAWHADDPAFDITGDLTFESLFEPDTIAAGSRILVDKLSATDGYRFAQDGDELRLYIHNSATTDCDVVTTGSVLAADTWARAKPVYDASAQEISFWVHGAEVARASNAEQTGCALTGTIPAAIGVNATRLTIGADSAGANLFDGQIDFAGFDNAEHDNGGCLEGSACVGYWGWGGRTLWGYSNWTLTGANLDYTNFVDCTAYAWIQMTLSATQNPTLLVIDRRHNLTSSATVRLLRGDHFGSFDSVATPTVTAGQPIVARFSSTTNTQWWLEIHDPGNPDGCIEIPHVYLGSYTSMERAHLRAYDWSQPRPGAFQEDSLGDLTSYIRGEQGWSKDLKFRCNAADLTTLQAVIAEASLARPVVFCEDVSNEATKTRLVQLPGSLHPKFKHIIGAGHWVWLPAREVSCGL